MKTFKDLFGSLPSNHAQRNMQMIDELMKQDLETLEGGLESAINLQDSSNAMQIARNATESIIKTLTNALNDMKNAKIQEK